MDPIGSKHSYTSTHKRPLFNGTAFRWFLGLPFIGCINQAVLWVDERKNVVEPGMLEHWRIQGGPNSPWLGAHCESSLFTLGSTCREKTERRSPDREPYKGGVACR